jgi:predicted RNA binding protein YcfA (HicA-like mRNA interferase family)
MSPSAYPRLSGSEVVKALGKLGFEAVGTRGSHCKVRKGSATAIVPLHKELAVGTLASVLRQAGVTLDDLKAQL